MVTRLAPLGTQFLRERLLEALGRRRQTCEIYAHAFGLWFVFGAERHGVRPSQLYLGHLDVGVRS